VAVHAGALVLLLALVAFQAADLSHGNANAAPGTLFFLLVLVLPVLLLGVPSIMALVSWRLCHRQGVEPSPGHMGLTVAGALTILVFLAWVMLSWALVV
jgi:hypothetical protein